MMEICGLSRAEAEVEAMKWEGDEKDPPPSAEALFPITPAGAAASATMTDKDRWDFF